MIRKIICSIAFILYAVNAISQVAVTHTVKEGESLNGIAQKYGVTTEMLKKANPDIGDYFYAGMVLNIPVKLKLDDSHESDSLSAKFEGTPKEQQDSTFFTSGIVSGQPTEAKASDESQPDNKIKPGEIWKPLTATILAGLNLSDLTGDGAKGINPKFGVQIGASVDFLNNKPIGFEGDVIFNLDNMSIKSENYSGRVTSYYLDLMLLLNARLFIKKFALEANLGFSADIGLDGHIFYDSKEIPSYNLFKGNKYSDGMIENISGAFVYGLTFKEKRSRLRILIHQGIPNISKSENDKIRLWSADFSFGISF